MIEKIAFTKTHFLATKKFSLMTYKMFEHQIQINTLITQYILNRSTEPHQLSINHE